MKRIACLIMALLVMALLPGCKAPEPDTRVVSDGLGGKEVSEGAEPLRVLIDLGVAGSVLRSEKERDETLEGFPEAIAELGGPADISFEFPFFSYTNERDENNSLRDAELTRLRTEIMAGKGPDVFITACENITSSIYGDPLFKYPDQIMRRHTFLTLDNYIEKAQFMEWEKLTPIIMEAGRTEEGQQVLPMTYSLPVVLCRQKDIERDHSKTKTFYDMIENPPFPLLTVERPLEGAAIAMDVDRLAGVFSQVADYDTEQLAFSEEDLLRAVEAVGEQQAREAGMDETVSAFYYSDLGVAFNGGFDHPYYEGTYGGIQEGDAVRFLPLYSVEGGYGAFITSFAAINRNTKRPDDAFFVLDYLLSRDCQRSPLYANVTEDKSMPVHEELMYGRRGTVVSQAVKSLSSSGREWLTWKMGKDNFEEFCSLRENISAVRFRTELDGKILNALNKGRYLSDNQEAAAREIHAAYVEMQMMLAES